ncbi:helix-turn-helix transcriptional regulator [Streptomyces canus]|uniref:helix-turn-helix domain-containing protein n=1 Tax=Streptomyces canus TaxID=58343 RepID=UPI002251E3D3|nr:helix-turn-helix transcriptional regulator [Streptomyces canus]MCX4859301.1 helix-turn-helix transcriptional regulator [Streptomyces canus]WSW40978.1 helix-turn-helix transcriptional regulator [Streptomyces canus]
MPGPKDLDPSSSPRALLGAELRHAREKAGLSQEELGQRLFVSGSFVGQLEAGTRTMQPEYARLLDEVLGMEDFFQRNCGAAAKSKYPEHFAEAAEAEARASAISQYAPLLIPGLLQTSAYAEAVFRAYRPTAPDAEIDALVAARLERTRLLDNPTTPLLWMVLDEAALRRWIGGGTVMAEALRHVASLARRRRIIVQVLPFRAGAHAALDGPLKLMEFDDAPALSFVEAPDAGKLSDDPATVVQHTQMFKLLLAVSLSPSDSLALIESVAQDYAHEEHP